MGVWGCARAARVRVCVCVRVCVGVGACVCVCAYLHKYTVTLGEYMGYTWGYRGTDVGNTGVHTGDTWGGEYTGNMWEYMGTYGEHLGNTRGSQPQLDGSLTTTGGEHRYRT